jgi:hypothetical protein
MAWRIARGRYGADALTAEEIQKLEAAPETATDHIDHRCNACRCAARDQRGALQPLLSDLQHQVRAHGHAATLRPDLDHYDVAIAIHADGTPCHCAPQELHTTPDPLLRDVLHVALAHGHAVTLRPDLDSNAIAVEIHPERAQDSDDRIRNSRLDDSMIQLAMQQAR